MPQAMALFRLFLFNTRIYIWALCGIVNIVKTKHTSQIATVFNFIYVYVGGRDHTRLLKYTCTRIPDTCN